MSNNNSTKNIQKIEDDISGIKKNILTLNEWTVRHEKDDSDRHNELTEKIQSLSEQTKSIHEYTEIVKKENLSEGIADLKRGHDSLLLLVTQLQEQVKKTWHSLTGNGEPKTGLITKLDEVKAQTEGTQQWQKKIDGRIAWVLLGLVAIAGERLVNWLLNKL